MSNRVKQLRTKAKLTQRQLADAARTSQQQIQRIEAGASVPRLELAIRISKALNQEVALVFPMVGQALRQADRTRPAGKLYDSRQIDAVSQAAGAEVDPRQWTLKVQLRGHSDPRLIPIGAEYVRQLRSIIQEQNESTGRPYFFQFESDHTAYVLNLRDAAYVQFLSDPAFPPTTKPAEATHDFNVRLVLSGSDTVHVFMTDPDEWDRSVPGEIGQLADMLFCLDAGTAEAWERVSFTDADGETVFIRVGDIAMLEVPLVLLNRAGEADEPDDELAEGDGN